MKTKGLKATTFLWIAAIALFTNSIQRVNAGDHPWLQTLDANKDYKKHGKRLMSLSLGLNPLEKVKGHETILLIGVHGGKSQGYEWIYPLQVIDNIETATFFYRWNDRECSLPAANSLLIYIKETIKTFPQLNKIILIGHSYGGVLVSSLVESWDHALPIEVHSIASPLKEGGLLSTKCNYRPPNFIASKVTFNQWRTQHHLDGAFNRLKKDPQVLSLVGSKVTRLPETYRGRRLGHNWSISWVADELGTQK